MNVMLVTSSYPPEVRSSSHLMQELAESLRERGHKITVATTYPYYNLSADNEKTSFSRITVENDIKVLRIKTPHPHSPNHLIRGFSQIILPHIFFLNIKMFIKHKIDVVIVYSPPLTLAEVGSKLQSLYGAKFILNVQDIFPQNAIDLGVIKNQILIRLFEWIEKSAYKHADALTVHSENNMHFLINRKGVPKEKLFVVHNWIDVKPYENSSRTGRFRESFGIKDKFNFLFAGVMGPSQGLELIVRIANRLRNLPDLCFLFVGNGTEKRKLMKMVLNYRLENVFFKAFVSKEEYPFLVKDADVGLVCLSSKNKTPVVPGKILGYMAASVPVLALLNKESDGHFIVRDSRCGYSVVSDNEDKAVELVLKIYEEKSKINDYGRNGFNYVLNHFTKDLCIDQLEKLFDK